MEKKKLVKLATLSGLKLIEQFSMEILCTVHLLVMLFVISPLM